MNRRLAALFLLLPALAFAHNWKVDPAGSTLGFSGTYQGDPFHGMFKQFDAKIRYDPDELAQARFDVTIDLASVDTQSEERDQTLAGSDFFDTGKTPEAHFVSDSITRGADGKIVARGTLNLHGVDKPVTLAVDFVPAGDKATLSVSADVSRLDWNLGSSSDWDDISRDIRVEATLHLVSP